MVNRIQQKMETSLKGRLFLVCLMGILVTGAANGQTIKGCVQKLEQDGYQQFPDLCTLMKTFGMCFATVMVNAAANGNVNLEQLIKQMEESLKKTTLPEGLDINEDKLSECDITTEELVAAALSPDNRIPGISKMFEKDQLHEFAECFIKFSQLDLDSMEVNESCDAIKNAVACQVRSLDLENIDQTSPQWIEIEQLLKDHPGSKNNCSLNIEDVLALASRSSTIYGSFVVVASVIISFMMFY